LLNISLETRYAYNLDSTASTLALLLIISLRPKLGSLTAHPKLSALAILNFSMIVVSLSRVNLSIALVSLVFVYSHNRFIRAAVIAATLIMIAAPFMQISHVAWGNSMSGSSGFFEKVINSQQEARISNYYNIADMNEHWRGYEAYLGINQVLKIGGWANLIGLGFGSYALGPFADKLQHIPFFHNGFVTIFLKSGSLGLVIFAIFVGKLFFVSRSAFVKARSISDPQIARAGIVVFLFTNSMLLRTLTTHGVYYAKTTLELFFIGLSIYVIGRLWHRRATAHAFNRGDRQHGPSISHRTGHR